MIKKNEIDLALLKEWVGKDNPPFADNSGNRFLKIWGLDERSVHYKFDCFGDSFSTSCCIKFCIKNWTYTPPEPEKPVKKDLSNYAVIDMEKYDALGEWDCISDCFVPLSEVLEE